MDTEKLLSIVKTLIGVLLKLLEGVGLEGAKDYEEYADQFVDLAATALASDEKKD